MKMLLSEAGEYWCPFAKPGRSRSGTAPINDKCLGEGCAAWVTLSRTDNKSGHCGLTGVRTGNWADV